MKFIKNKIKDIKLINLTEARRNPDQNPKISAYEALKPYSESEKYFISFTKIDKLGINPKSRFNTPLGIYCYPLKDIWIEYNVDKLKSVGEAVPFAGEEPYIWLIKVKESLNFINNMYTDYDSKDYDDDINLLKEDILNNKRNYENLFVRASFELDVNNVETNDSNFQDWIKEMFQIWTESAKERNPIMSMWNVTKNLASYKKGKASVQWNVLLRKVLGYDGFADRSGKGYIHSSEPTQAVFLSKSAFEIEGEFLNKDYNSLDDFPDWLKKADYSPSADFSVTKAGDIIWHLGNWEKGIWKDGFWEDGVWGDGTWKNGTWEDGIWQDGTWRNGVWKDGLWKYGQWEKGTWQGGIWESGWWWGGKWKDGLWKNGTWLYGVWENGTWENGNWDFGTWEKGIWKDGIWKKGTWENGTWIEGYIYDPDLGKVYSKVSPKEYFERKKKQK